MGSQEPGHELSLGKHDPFRDLGAMDEETAQEWIRLLDLRAVAPDQIALRRKLIDMLDREVTPLGATYSRDSL
jgi:hypothetical protein